MSTAPTTAAPSANTKASNPVPKNEDQDAAEQAPPQAGNGDTPHINWDSEIQVVSSLAKLQELERKVRPGSGSGFEAPLLRLQLCTTPLCGSGVNQRLQIHELRQSLPEGLLEPLISISSSNASALGNSAAESPPLLRGDLDQAARTGLADIEKFQSMWRGPELKPVWDHVEARIKASNGQPLQPTGVWEKDYDVLVRELVKAEKAKEEERLREEENAERVKAQSSEGEWEATAERFIQRNVPGVRVTKGQSPLSLAVALAKAGMILLVEGVKEPDVVGVSEWQVSVKTPPGRVPTKLELSILECLNSRPRKWDLAFLLVWLP